MAITGRALGSIGLLLVIWFLPSFAMAQEYPFAFVPLSDPRVRSTSARLHALIRKGSELSPTFEGLLASIEATDGIVYVDEGKCPHSVSACLAHQGSAVGIGARVEKEPLGDDTALVRVHAAL